MKYVFIIIIIFLSACTIVDNPDSQIVGDVVPTVDLGSMEVPDEEAAFAATLHGNSSKTWSAEQFTIEKMPGFLPCRLDDVVTLSADGTYSYDGGESLCGAEDNQRLKTGTWEYDFSANELTFDPGINQESIAQIVTLVADSIVLQGEYNSALLGALEVKGRYSSVVE